MSEPTDVRRVPPVPWRIPLTGRDPDEQHRAATPLELFFDLAFVVAVAAAAAELHHELSAGHLGALSTYAMIFFAIWWAWVNYSWFASAYDTGDTVFRLMTFVVITGVLVLAASIPAVSGAEHDFTLTVIGYAIMRIAMVPMWLRVARDHPGCRTTAQHYAVGITVLQVLWISRLWFQDGTLGIIGFVVLAAAEMAVPWWAEHRGGRTPWHRHHIAERYALFTIIVLGECILATTQAISASLDLHGSSADLFLVVAGALLLVFGMWWIYFQRPMVPSPDGESAFVFGYAHYFILGAVAAVGAALAATVDIVQHEAHGVENLTAALFLAGAVGVYLLALGGIHAVEDRSLLPTRRPVLVTVLMVAAAILGTAISSHIGPSVLLIGLVLSAAVLDHQVRD